MPPLLTHVALHVQDVDGCVRFYREYCGLEIIHDRGGSGPGKRVVWLGGARRERGAVIVLLEGGQGRDQDFRRDFSHLGFAVESRAALDEVAARAEQDGRLVWPIRDDRWPAGSYCGVRDPAGNAVEFSYGQPLGPGAPAKPSAGD